MSKLVSVILVLVLFLGPVVNSFAEKDEGHGPKDYFTDDNLYIVGGIMLAGGLIVLFGWLVVEWFKGELRVEAETPDNGIRMVSTEDEVPSVNSGDKTILNVLQHVEAGVTPNKDIYVGFRFQY